ncbi:ABC-2 transporter permease [Eisenbergiella tayi]|uniref:ABC-2 transporter permease n=1 Tax=Eisenbergiella tayi TaxID=1432052 RepID=UPI0007A8E992|nr:hypothetical protein BN3660_03398 [Eubacteriaceae bacterium CHKCI004]
MLMPLIKKDLTIVKGYTLGVVAIAFGLPLLLAWRQPQMGGMISLLMAVLISSVAFNLAISEKENQYPKATALLSSTPYTKGKVIVSKYALYFIIYIVCFIAYLVEMQFVPELKLVNFARTAALVFLIQALGMGIFLPIQYKFGYEKTKFISFVLLVLSPVIIEATKRISFSSKIVSLMQSNSVIAVAILYGCGILIWLVSFVISNKIFAKKDLI